MGGKGEGDFFSFFGDLASPPFSTGAGALPWKGSGKEGLLLAVVDRREERKGLYYCSIIPQTDDRLGTRLVCLEWNSPILGRIEKLYKLCKLAL